MTSRAFEHEYHRLYMPLCMYALRLLADLDEAKDVVQESFLTVWERLEAGIEIDSFKPYMYRMVRNAALLRLQRRDEPYDSGAMEEASDISDETYDTAERDARLWEAIDRLPAKCREIFLMSKRDGMSDREIADELGISVKTVGNQKSKAFRELRHQLEGRSGKVFFLPFF